MRTTKYCTYSDSITIPPIIQTDRDKDFYLTLHKRIQHDRQHIDLDCLFYAYLYHRDYEDTWKMYAIDKATKTYGYFSRLKKLEVKLDRQLKHAMKFNARASKKLEELDRRERKNATEKHID